VSGVGVALAVALELALATGPPAPGVSDAQLVRAVSERAMPIVLAAIRNDLVMVFPLGQGYSTHNVMIQYSWSGRAQPQPAKTH